jgi:glucosylceramidase
MKSRLTTFLAAIAIACSFSAIAASSHNDGVVEVFATAKDTGERLAKRAEIKFAQLPQPTEQQQAIFVDPSRTFQKLIGIGGALTDASAETFYKLPKDKQHEILTAYFDPIKGIGYTLGRTHINSCDFSSSSYTYVQRGDAGLASFSVAHDEKYRIPFIKEVLAAADPSFTLYASPWSPPAWMKSNDNMLRGGTLLPEYADAWARYFARFIRAYEAEGIPIWGLTVQNEPMATQSWESCIYSAQAERDFVKNHLGPVLKKSGMSGVKLMVWDHNRGMMYQRASTVLSDPDAAQYVWGVACHWYMGDNFDNITRVQEAFPDTHVVFSEGCNGPFNMAQINDWKWGELYGKAIINDFNHGVVGWTDWNVLLDEHGGPNHVGNFCFAPIHGDTRSGKLHYMNSYYYIGQISKFVRSGARRISCSSTMDEMLATAFLNPDGTVAVVVMNDTDSDHPFYLWLNGRAAKADSNPHSILTLVFGDIGSSDGNSSTLSTYVPASEASTVR